MPVPRSARTFIVCLFALGLTIAFAGHRHKTQQQAAKITWSDVNTELQHVEQARLELFSSLHTKLADQR